MGDIADGALKTTASIPRVDLSGTSFEIGLQHGTQLRTQIHSQLSIYHTIFAALSKLTWPQVLTFAEKFDPTIKRLAPDLYEEMEGIAKGAGVPMVEIVALNARSEIALGVLGSGDGSGVGNDGGNMSRSAEVVDGCTSLAWTVDAGGGRKRQILAQNWDWTFPIGENLALASINQPGKPKIWMVIEPGIVGKIGFNSSSVGVCLNAIRARALDTSLLPIHLLLRIALQSHSIDHAVSAIERLGGSASSQHILIADASSGGGGRALEVSPNGNVYIAPDKRGVVVHTNHFIENRFVEEIPWNIRSQERLARISELVDEILHEFKNNNTNPNQIERGDKITPQLLRSRIFSDTQGAPQGICCYKPANENDGRPTGTLFNIVMQFEVGKEPFAEVLFGRPEKKGEGPVYRAPW